MADSKITALAENTAPISTDYFVTVDDPAGTPVTKFVKGSNMYKATGAMYPLVGGLGNSDPADSTTYYFGQPDTMIISVVGLTTATQGKIIVPKAGTITRVDARVITAGTLATTETSILSLRLNNLGDTTISSVVAFNAKSVTYSATVSIAVIAGDYFEYKLVTPAWATNPTSVYIKCTAWIE